MTNTINLNVVILGAGRMGIRHAQGLLNHSNIAKLFVVDLSIEALNNARAQLNNPSIIYLTLKEFENLIDTVHYAIVASTANNRVETALLLIKKGVLKVLIEKPLGQSEEEVKELVQLFKNTNIEAFVNLNMRQYDFFIQLKNDLNSSPQLQGFKSITVNTGAIGIGANGIHYLDLILFLTNAYTAEIVYSEIEDNLLPSGRGKNFNDFGGICLLDLFDNLGNKIARVYLSITSYSSAFGGWEIISPNGRIYFNEIDGKLISVLRKPDSLLPLHRYAADYDDAEVITIKSPFLGELTRSWFDQMLKGNNVLPRLDESLLVHKILFGWLKSFNSNSSFPIT
jgi:predicted dehydrogenase